MDDDFLKNSVDDETTGTFTINKESSATNSVTDVFTLKSPGSGTPATGIGVGMAFGIETTAGNVETGARIETSRRMYPVLRKMLIWCFIQC